MKTAILALTRGGAEKARAIAGSLDGEVDLYIKERFKTEGDIPITGSLSDLIKSIFHNYDALVFVMALGIVVRSLSGLPQDKRTDPAVVCVDEEGKNVICVLSGHIGGANDLTRKIASCIGANPVITTATDVLGLPCVEDIAKKNDLKIGDGDLTAVNSGIVNADKVVIFSDEDLQGTGDLAVHPVAVLEEAEIDTAIIITDKLMDIERPHIFLRPPILTAGVGARKGITTSKVLEAIKNTFSDSGLSLDSLRTMATIDIKVGEPGIREASKVLGVHLMAIPKDAIKGVQDAFEGSDFVEENIGVRAVAEPAAVMAKKGSTLIVEKQKHDGVTVAIGRIER